MPLEFDIPKSSLLAMLPIAPTSDVRYYLNGIAFDVRHDGCKLIVTDGHRMLVQQLDCLSPEVVTDADNFVVIFPREFIQSISKFKKQLLRIKVGPAIPDSHAREIVIVGDLAVTSRSIDGVFPKWEFAIPRHFSGEPAQLNPDLLTGFMDAKIMQMGYKKRDRHLAVPNLTLNGQTNAALVELTATMVGYIQPMKGDYSTGLNPDWLGLTPTPHPLSPKLPNDHNVRIYGSSVLANIEVPFFDALGKTREELKEYLTGLVVGKDSSTAINAPLFSPVAIKSGNIVFSLAALRPSK